MVGDSRLQYLDFFGKKKQVGNFWETGINSDHGFGYCTYLCTLPPNTLDRKCKDRLYSNTWFKRCLYFGSALGLSRKSVFFFFFFFFLSITTYRQIYKPDQLRDIIFPCLVSTVLAIVERVHQGGLLCVESYPIVLNIGLPGIDY